MKKLNYLGVLCTLATLVACGGNPSGKPSTPTPSGGGGSNSSDPNSSGSNSDPSTPYNGLGWSFVGRLAPGNSNPNAPQTLSWPASGVVSRFKGTSSVTVNVALQANAAFNLVIDGQTPIPVTQASQAVNGLDPSAVHTLQLIKKNEAQYGTATFSGITLDSGGEFVAPPTAARRIEIIGDSISAGYGDLGTSALCHGDATNEDSTQAYGPLTATALQADVHVIAWSGQGLTRDNTGNTSTTMPMIWQRSLATDSTTSWDFSQWVPQVVVINLGTNDFYTGIPVASTFETAYAQFIATIRANYGADTHIFCAVGPMLGQDSLLAAEQYVKAVVSTANRSGDAKVHYIEFPVQNVDVNTGAGAACDYHPNLTTQRSMATDVLVPAIKQALGW